MITYLASTSDPAKQFGGLEHLSIFQRMMSPEQSIRTRETTPKPDITKRAHAPGNWHQQSRGPAQFDMTPTATQPGGNSTNEAVLKPAATLSGYTLLSVAGDRAIIQTRDGLINVTQGETVGGAGVLISIQRKAGEWVVLTESGYIGAKQPQ
jgi:hypothetical protein